MIVGFYFCFVFGILFGFVCLGLVFLFVLFAWGFVGFSLVGFGISVISSCSAHQVMNMVRVSVVEHSF